MPTGRPNLSYNVPAGATATQSPVVSVGTIMIRIASTGDAWVAFGPNPTANSTSSMLIRASTAGEEFPVFPGDRISVLQVTSGCTVNITELC